MDVTFVPGLDKLTKLKALVPSARTAPDNGAGLARQQQNDCGPFLGLCLNCEDRETCIYPKPEGGVWRCEEYR